MLGNSSLGSCTGSGPILWSRGEGACHGPSLLLKAGWPHALTSSVTSYLREQSPTEPGIAWAKTECAKAWRSETTQLGSRFCPSYPNAGQVATSHQVWGTPVSPLGSHLVQGLLFIREFLLQQMTSPYGKHLSHELNTNKSALVLEIFIHYG